MGKSSAPPAPDYGAAAKETSSGNLDLAKYTTQANRANQYTPYGSLEWSQGKNADGTDNNQWSQNINLNATGQGLLNAANKTSLDLAGLQGQATNKVKNQQAQGWNDQNLAQSGTALSADGKPYGLSAAYDPTQATNTATDAIMARVNPQLDRRRQAAETQLANQGITRGSEAWKAAQSDLGQSENDAYSQAGLQGINLGMQQQGQTYGQTLQGAQEGLQAQNQGFNQANALRSAGLQEQNYVANRDMNQLNAIRTGSQVTNPTFGSYAQQAQTAGPDMLGAANSQYNAALGATNAQNASSAGLMSGLFSLGSAAVPYAFSDERLKKDIKRVGELPNGIGVYVFTYIGEEQPQLGCIAQDVMKIMPDAVLQMTNGYYAVNYAEVLK